MTAPSITPINQSITEKTKETQNIKKDDFYFCSLIYLLHHQHAGYRQHLAAFELVKEGSHFSSQKASIAAPQ